MQLDEKDISFFIDIIECINDILEFTDSITYNEFEKVLREFIERYVLCKQCSLPELKYTVEKNKKIRICKSCSYTDSIKK